MSLVWLAAMGGPILVRTDTEGKATVMNWIGRGGFSLGWKTFLEVQMEGEKSDHSDRKVQVHVDFRSFWWRFPDQTRLSIASSSSSSVALDQWLEYYCTGQLVSKTSKDMH